MEKKEKSWKSWFSLVSPSVRTSLSHYLNQNSKTSSGDLSVFASVPTLGFGQTWVHCKGHQREKHDKFTILVPFSNQSSAVALQHPWTPPCSPHSGSCVQWGGRVKWTRVLDCAGIEALWCFLKSLQEAAEWQTKFLILSFLPHWMFRPVNARKRKDGSVGGRGGTIMESCETSHSQKKEGRSLSFTFTGFYFIQYHLWERK